MSKILDSARRFRLELIRGNNTALKEMARAYLQTWARLQIRLEAVIKQIADARASGIEPRMSWLVQQERYQLLMGQVEAEMQQFAPFAAQLTRQEQSLAVRMGLTYSASLAMQSLGPAPAGIAVTWNQVPVAALENLVGFLRDGSTLEYKFTGLAPDVTQGIRDTFASSFAIGQNPRVIAQEIKRTYGSGLSNAPTVCRTEAMRAYRQASLESYRANDDIVTGYVRMSAHSVRTCAACWADDGRFYNLAEDFSDHPRGRCTIVPVTKSWNEIAGRETGIPDTSVKPWNPEDWFRKLPEKQQLAILGKARLDLWKSGQVSFRDFATMHRSEVWGDYVRPTTIKELLAMIKN
jgi:SPP1 gp7 family putative phage head morphogenesis protein